MGEDHEAEGDCLRCAIDSSGSNKSIPSSLVAGDQITAEVYDELRRLAGDYIRRDRIGHTLQRTALVHEAYLRLLKQGAIKWVNRAHFLGVFARLMRQTLTNYAVARGRIKRGGNDRLHAALEFYESRGVNVPVLDIALSELEALDQRQAQIVELRFFAGLTVSEIANAMGISQATVKREWLAAKEWLRTQLSNDATYR
jgi:RNA polymerase sigma-70 factor (ECF subfamily)